MLGGGRPCPRNTADRNYGVCVDLGSTTVCMRLVDLSTGETICQDSAYNRQIAFGEDILTRVFYSKDNAPALEEIRQATLASFREVLEGLERKKRLSCGQLRRHDRCGEHHHDALSPGLGCVWRLCFSLCPSGYAF